MALRPVPDLDLLRTLVVVIIKARKAVQPLTDVVTETILAKFSVD